MIRLRDAARALVQLSGFVTALGFVILVDTVWFWRAETEKISDAPAWLLIPGALALGAWVRIVSKRRPLDQRSPERAFIETALFASGVLFGASVFAPGPGHPTRETAAVATMKGDLRNLVTAEDQVFADSGRYAAHLGRAYYYTNSGVRGPNITLTADGWTASIAHEWSPRTCVIFTGTTALAPAVRAAEPACTPPPPARSSTVVVWGLGLVGTGVLLAVVGRAVLKSASAPTA